MKVVRDLEINNWWILERFTGRDIINISTQTQCWTCSKCLTLRWKIERKIVFYTDKFWMDEFWSEYTVCSKDHPFVSQPKLLNDKINSTLPLIKIPSSRIFQHDCPDYLPDSALWSWDYETMSDEQVGNYIYYWWKYCHKSDYVLNAIEKSSLQKLLTYLMGEHWRARLEKLRISKLIKTNASQWKISQLFDKQWVLTTDFMSLFQDAIQQS